MRGELQRKLGTRGREQSASDMQSARRSGPGVTLRHRVSKQ